jgi:hypothetical protein
MTVAPASDPGTAVSMLNSTGARRFLSRTYFV